MKTAFRWLIQLYRLFVSPLLGPRCRFFPSCSLYSLEALEQHRLHYALWLIIKRLVRCHPWGGSGYDPVPTPDKQSSKPDSQKKRNIHQRISKFMSCSCCNAELKSSPFFFKVKQNGHQIHSDLTFTNPPPYRH
jgi:putative membrane protein insertion efficiency factor